LERLSQILQKKGKKTSLGEKERETKSGEVLDPGGVKEKKSWQQIE